MAMTALVVLSVSGYPLARRLANELGVPLHGRMTGVDLMVADIPDHLRRLFGARTRLVFVGALGVLVRVLAPSMTGKTSDPPVVVVAEDGSSVIPVLGGHHGANDLARQIGGKLGVVPAITTASDLRFGMALDEPRAGWHMAPGTDYRSFMTRLLAGAAVRLDGVVPWLTEAGLPLAADAELTIRAIDQQVESDISQLVFHPETLALGLGCVRNAPPEAVVAHAHQTLSDAGLARESVAVVVSVDVKMDEPAIHAVGEDLGRPVRFFGSARLEAETPRLATPSATVFDLVGCHGVAEAAALAAAGDSGVLVVPKRRISEATCAVARAPGVIDVEGVGQPRGRLFVVGTGPGSSDWQTPEVARLVGLSGDLVGYGPYLDLLGPLITEKRCHAYALGEERDRAVAALDLAASGRAVALVSSGDPGIYAMASLVFECMEAAGRSDWDRVDITVAPGISALQACAARIGAPVGHDFCVISLSDLLTPRAIIERRLAAAAAGDFVVALYNPASGRRRRLLVRAMEILGAARPPETPVVTGRQIGRPGESVTVSQLATFEPETIDMLSLVIVGNAQSRIANGRVFTPRGYVVDDGAGGS